MSFSHTSGKAVPLLEGIYVLQFLLTSSGLNTNYSFLNEQHLLNQITTNTALPECAPN